MQSDKIQRSKDPRTAPGSFERRPALTVHLLDNWLKHPNAIDLDVVAVQTDIAVSFATILYQFCSAASLTLKRRPRTRTPRPNFGNTIMRPSLL